MAEMQALRLNGVYYELLLKLADFSQITRRSMPARVLSVQIGAKMASPHILAKGETRFQKERWLVLPGKRDEQQTKKAERTQRARSSVYSSPTSDWAVSICVILARVLSLVGEVGRGSLRKSLTKE